MLPNVRREWMQAVLLSLLIAWVATFFRVQDPAKNEISRNQESAFAGPNGLVDDCSWSSCI